MNSEKGPSRYDELPEDNELVSRYQPRFLNRGGEHLVYLVDGHPNLVIKASTYKIKDSVMSIIDRQGDVDDSVLESEAREKYEDEIKKKNEEIRQLRSSFGKEHTLKERRYLMKVPVSHELLKEIFYNDYFARVLPDSAKNINEVWTHVVVQEFTKISNDPNRLSLTYGHFLENGDVDPELYKRVTSVLVDPLSIEFKERDFLDLQDCSRNKSLSNLITMAETDNQLREQLELFVKNAIEYAERTGQILALAGEDNVLFSQENGVWDFLLVDALPNSPEPIFQIIKGLSEKISKNINLTSDDKEYLKRGINFVRIINGIARSLGLQDQLKLPDIFLKANLLEIINKK
jgi:hypothetical protein